MCGFSIVGRCICETFIYIVAMNCKIRFPERSGGGTKTVKGCNEFMEYDFWSRSA